MERITPSQQIFREGIRFVGHPLVFRNKTELVEPDGLTKFHELLADNKGGIVVATHFSAFDPVWVMNEVTKKHGLRSVHITGPIRIDRTNPKLSKIMHWGGVDMTGIVTPHAFEEAEEKGNPKGFERGQGLQRYFTQATETIKAGGLVAIASTPERQAKLILDEYDSLATLLFILKSKGLTSFGIHFVSPSIKGVTDYSRHRSFPTAFRRGHMRHGATYTAQELWDMAESRVDPSLDRKTRRDAVNRKITKIAFEEFKKIVPTEMLPDTEKTT